MNFQIILLVGLTEFDDLSSTFSMGDKILDFQKSYKSGYLNEDNVKYLQIFSPAECLQNGLNTSFIYDSNHVYIF